MAVTLATMKITQRNLDKNFHLVIFTDLQNDTRNMYIITRFLIIHVKMLFLFPKESKRLSRSSKCQQLHAPLLKCTLVTTETNNVRWANATSAKCMIWLRVILLATFQQKNFQIQQNQVVQKTKTGKD